MDNAKMTQVRVREARGPNFSTQEMKYLAYAWVERSALVDEQNDGTFWSGVVFLFEKHGGSPGRTPMSLRNKWRELQCNTQKWLRA